MLKAYKYRIYPNKEQEVLLNKHFGACRFIYNLALETKISAYASGVNLNKYALCEQLTDLKKECGWLKEVNSQSLQQQLMHLDAAYLGFFKGHNKFPIFKKRRNRQSFPCPQNVSIENGKIRIPKFQSGITINQHREFKGEIKTTTISKTVSNKYFVSILVGGNKELQKTQKVKETTTIGIDLGIKTFAVLSDGTQYENPKHLKRALNRLKTLQKRASKKEKGSNNRKKANLRVALAYEKVVNQRTDFLHKFSDAITKQYDTICVEDLNISGMLKNHKLAQAISDVRWATGLQFLKYKSEWRGKNYIEIGRFEASSKIHNKCGFKNEVLTLADREWYCPTCNEMVLRDENAAQNIKELGLKKHSGEGISGEPAELLLSDNETGSIEKYIPPNQ